MVSASQAMHLLHTPQAPKHFKHNTSSTSSINPSPYVKLYMEAHEVWNTQQIADMFTPNPYRNLRKAILAEQPSGVSMFSESQAHSTIQPSIPRVQNAADNQDHCFYVIDRGNGEYTRLIPADMLPPLQHVPAREPRQESMIILPIVRSEEQLKTFLGIKNQQQQQGGDFGNEGVQKSIDQIVTTSPSSLRRGKVYCDKWVHEGVCAFTQQGCKFRHEMPFDENVQRSLGLFQGFPAWWKKRNEEMGVCRSSSSSSNASFTSPRSSDRRGDALKQDVDKRNFPPGHLHGNIPMRPVEPPGLGNGQGASNSPWMRSGIVPFVRGPMRPGHHQRSSTMSSWCSMGTDAADFRANSHINQEYNGARENVGPRVV